MGHFPNKWELGLIDRLNNASIPVWCHTARPCTLTGSMVALLVCSSPMHQPELVWIYVNFLNQHSLFWGKIMYTSCMMWLLFNTSQSWNYIVKGKRIPTRYFFGRNMTSSFKSDSTQHWFQKETEGCLSYFIFRVNGSCCNEVVDCTVILDIL